MRRLLDGGTDTCGSEIKPSSNSTIYPNANPYGGIPTNLTINAIGFVVLIFVFLVIRRNAWKALNSFVRKDDDERVADDDVDSIISPGTEESVIRSSIGAQSREKQRLSGSEPCINETTSHN